MIVIALHALTLAATPLLSFSPFKIFVLSQALQKGWRQSLPLALTPLAADIPVIILVWFVLRQLPTTVLDILRISGGLFFLYLAYILYKNVQKMQISANEVASVPSRTFLQAITAIWLSPGIYINWTIIGVPALLTYAELSIWRSIAFLIIFYILWIGGLSLQIILFSQAGKINEKANTVLIMIACLLLVGFAFYQIWLGFNGLSGEQKVI